MFGISAEWWILYVLIIGVAVPFCNRLNLIRAAVVICADQSLNIPNMHNLILDIKNEIEDSKIDREEISTSILNVKEIIDERISELHDLLKKVEGILEVDQMSRDKISEAVTEINSEIIRGIRVEISREDPGPTDPWDLLGNPDKG